MEKKKVVIVEIVRTPWGRPGGSLSKFISSDLAAAAIKALLKKTAVSPGEIDQVVFGQAHPSTMPNNIGHYAWLKAELPVDVPGYTVQSNTASSLQAVRNAYYLISSGNEQLCIAGGVDSYSAAPFVMRDVRNHFYPQHRRIIDSLEEAECCTQPVPMSRLEQYQRTHPSRMSEEARRYIEASHENSRKLVEFSAAPEAFLSFTDRKKGEIVISEDEKLSPSDYGDNLLAPYADGAAAVMLADEQKAISLGLTPKAYLLGFAVAGGDTVDRLTCAVQASHRLLSRRGLSIDDISVVELLENSAEDTLAAARALGAEGRVNPLGGALALGLNDGAEGIAMLQRAVAALQSGQLGLISIYSAGGQGMAVLVEKC